MSIFVSSITKIGERPLRAILIRNEKFLQFRIAFNDLGKLAWVPFANILWFSQKISKSPFRLYNENWGKYCTTGKYVFIKNVVILRRKQMLECHEFGCRRRDTRLFKKLIPKGNIPFPKSRRLGKYYRTGKYGFSKMLYFR